MNLSQSTSALASAILTGGAMEAKATQPIIAMKAGETQEQAKQRHAYVKEKAREQQAIRLAAQDIWMSIRRFNGKPDQVKFVGFA